MRLALDLHNHSRHSYDSLLEPLKIIKKARARGLNGMAITDHGTIAGGLAMKQVNPYEDFLVIVGAEIRTEIGDIVGLFLTREITATSFREVAKQIHDQGGLVLLPHPGKLPVSLVEPYIDSIDLIEEWNARSKEKWNKCALELANRFDKPVLANSDAHSSFEIATAYTILEAASISTVRSDLLLAPRTLHRGKTNFYLSHITSVLTEKWKAKQF